MCSDYSNTNPISADTIAVVAAIILDPVDKNRFLIALRPPGKHLANYWELPGGKINSGETRFQALQRELEEEIGLSPQKAEPFMQVFHRYADRNISLDVWLVSEFCGLLRAREQQQLAWINTDQIANYRFPEADIPVLQRLVEWIQSEDRGEG